MIAREFSRQNTAQYRKPPNKLENRTIPSFLPVLIRVDSRPFAVQLISFAMQQGGKQG
jgi:hypothetical protein